MASSYGPWVAGDDWRSWVEIKIVSETETTATISVSGWFQADAGWSTYSNTVKGYLGYKIGSAADVWSSATAIDPFSAGSSKYFLTGTFKSVSVPKTKSAQTVKGYAEVDGYTGGGYAGSQSKATASITVSAKPTYTITYNANGGSGAPAAQTKWYGETLQLSSTKPTRANYNFKGWATSSSATTAAYQAGANYTGNAALTLYAVWELAYVAPTLTISAYRSDSSGNLSNESTTNIAVEYSWSLNQTGGTNTSGTVTINHGTSSADSFSISGATGSGKKTYTQTVAATSTLTVSVTIKDAHNLTTTRSVTVGQVFKPFTMANGGKAAAFFGFANATWDKILKIFGSLVVENHIDVGGKIKTYVEGARGDAGLRFYKSALNANHWNPAILIQTKSGGTWTIGNYDGEELRFVYFTKTNIDNSTNTPGLNLALGNTARSWHKAISPWTSIATTSGETAKTFSDVNTAGYSELLVVAKYSTTYRSSVVIPVADLDTTKRDWYLGGGTWNTAWGASCGMTRTQITPYKIRVGGTSQNADWTVYAR